MIYFYVHCLTHNTRYIDKKSMYIKKMEGFLVCMKF